MSAVKGAVLSLLTDAYQRRDKVALVVFRGEGAHLLLPPTSGVELAASRLQELPTGGRTPLSAGLEKATEVILRERTRDKERRPIVVLLTDGRATAGPDPLAAGARLRKTGASSVVVDTEEGLLAARDGRHGWRRRWGRGACGSTTCEPTRLWSWWRGGGWRERGARGRRGQGAARGAAAGAGPRGSARS